MYGMVGCVYDPFSLLVAPLSIPVDVIISGNFYYKTRGAAAFFLPPPPPCVILLVKMALCG